MTTTNPTLELDPQVALALPALRSVRPPRALRKLAGALALMLVVLPLTLLLAPWRQNVPGSGRVTAVDPLDRTQTIPVPVSGRLVELLVQEGDRVEKGQKLAELADQDPQYSLRLEQQYEASSEKVSAARDQVLFYERQLEFLEEARASAVDKSRFDLQQSIEKVRAEEQELFAAQAEAEQKRTDRERKFLLWKEGVVSELDFQKAEADDIAARAKVEAGKAKVEQAINEEKSKLADMTKIESDQRAKIESTRSLREEARSKVAEAEKQRTEAMTKLERQKTQTVNAPRAGTILRVHAASSADLLSQGEPLIELIPDSEALAVELWVRGNDAPLISPGRKVRLQFEGWPAVQVAGWPSVAVGTFGGVVHVMDAQARPDGTFRALVVPDPEDTAWPERRFLRQGVRTNGWVLLEDVSLGYELWRQLNAFPPSLQSAPELQDGPAKPAGGKADGKKGGKG